MQRQPGQSNRSRLLALTATIVGTVLLVACGSTEASEPAVPVPGGDVELGKAALEEYACVTCHVVPGIRAPETHVGPPLTAWAERHFIAGTLPNELDNLIVWIMAPQAVRPGTAMPNMGVPETDARHIAAYLYTLTE